VRGDRCTGDRAISLTLALDLPLPLVLVELVVELVRVHRDLSLMPLLLERSIFAGDEKTNR
jgi:hypothetical protein